MSESSSARWSKAFAAAAIVGVVAIVALANWREPRRSRDRFTIAPPIGTPGAPSTSRDQLARRIQRMTARLAERPDDTGAAVLLVDGLLRQSRVAANPGLVVEAEQTLRRILKEDPADYEALRMLGAVYLSQHRFREAIATAERCRDLRPHDAWNYGIMGDGYIELGEYDDAFDAFDTMVQMRPSAAAYARVAYAQELQGDVDSALRTLQMAAEATSAHDPEAQAWHYAQIGDLFQTLGRLVDAERAYNAAESIFPDHPSARLGMARLTTARGDYRGALELYRIQAEKTPMPEIEAQLGDLYSVLGDRAAAERHYVMAETGWRFDAPEPVLLARFLSDRDRSVEEAVKLAEGAAAARHDIFTEDALGWAYFKAGRLQEALNASARALRTGTRDRRILYHAAAIRHAAGDARAAKPLVERAVAGNPRFDIVLAGAASGLLESLNRAERVARR